MRDTEILPFLLFRSGRYEPGKEAIMIFDNICEVKDNYDHRLMELLVKHAPAFTVPLDEDAENVFMH